MTDKALKRDKKIALNNLESTHLVLWRLSPYEIPCFPIHLIFPPDENFQKQNSRNFLSKIIQKYNKVINN
jgi:hypothetical protein